MKVVFKYPLPGSKGRACLGKARNNLERHQMGFDGEHIGERTLKRLGYKGVKLTTHKAPFDLVTKSTAWEVKTVSAGSKVLQMNIKRNQKAKKLGWATTNNKKPKSMLVVVNDSASVYIKDGLGKFRPGGMKRVASSRDWRKEFGHGRTDRSIVKEKRIPRAKFVPATTIEDAREFARNNLLSDPSIKELKFADIDVLYDYETMDLRAANNLNKRLFSLKGKYKATYDGIAVLPLGPSVPAESMFFKDGTALLTVSSDFWADEAVLRRAIRRAGKSKWLASEKYTDIIDHEVAHILERKTGVLDLAKKNFEKRSKRLIKDVSRRGSFDPSELWAESFVLYERKKGVKWVSDMVEESLKKGGY